MLNLDPTPVDGGLAGIVRTCVAYRTTTGKKAPSKGQKLRRCGDYKRFRGIRAQSLVPTKNTREPYFVCSGKGDGGFKLAKRTGKAAARPKAKKARKSAGRKTSVAVAGAGYKWKVTKNGVKRCFEVKAGRIVGLAASAKCAGKGTLKGLGRSRKRRKGSRKGLRGLRGFFFGQGLFDSLAQSSNQVAVLSGISDASLNGAKPASRHCTEVGKSHSGSCACRSWTKGPALGANFMDLCNRAGLNPSFPMRTKGGMAGLAQQANAEFMADATPTLDGVPKACKSFKRVYSEALGKQVKVCSDFGDKKGGKVATLQGLDDAALAGPLAKWHGLGVVGGGLQGPLIWAGVGATALVLANKYAPTLPIVGGFGKYAGLVAAAGVAAALTRLPNTKDRAIQALLGMGLLTAVSFIAKLADAPVSPLGAIVSDDLGYFGAVTADEAAYEADAFGAYDDNINILSGGMGEPIDVLSAGDGVDVLSAIESDSLGGGDGIDVLSGAFGSLPFAGAI